MARSESAGSGDAGQCADPVRRSGGSDRLGAGEQLVLVCEGAVPDLGGLQRLHLLRSELGVE